MFDTLVGWQVTKLPNDHAKRVVYEKGSRILLGDLLCNIQEKIGKIRFKRYFWVLLIGLAAGYIPYAAVAVISDLNTKSGKYAAILLSADAVTGHDYWAPPVAFWGSYPSWTLYFNSQGYKTDYIFSATYQDFIEVLKDEKYQSIVLVGHGSFNCWKATDGLVTTLDVEHLAGQFKKKEGEWFQLSCPSTDYSPRHLAALAMASGDYYYYSGESADNTDFVLDALFAFSHIKAEKKMLDEHSKCYRSK